MLNKKCLTGVRAFFCFGNVEIVGRLNKFGGLGNGINVISP